MRPPIPSGAGFGGPHPVPACMQDPRGELAKMADGPAGSGPEGTGDLRLRALAHDSAESGAAAGEHGGKVLVSRVARIRVEEMLLHVLGRWPRGLLVGGAAGSQSRVSVHVACAARDRHASGRPLSCMP